MSQLKAGIRKDGTELFKTYRIYIFALGFVLFAVLDPVMMYALPKMMKAIGMDLSTMLGGMDAQTIGLSAYAGDCLQMGMLAMLLSMMKAAGGDQKDHSCVIPLCAGYRRSTYIYSKFCVYPLTAFGFGIIGYWLAYGVSYLLYPVKFPLSQALLLSLALAVFMAFAASLMLLIGCSTGRAGVSAVILFFAFTILNMILPLIRCDRFNPFALPGFLTGTMEQVENLPSFWVSVGIAALLCPVFALIAARLFQRKKLV